MAERPGIMFYFDILNVLEDFTPEEVGQLFLATMRYGSTGEITEFEDRGMRSVWRQMMQIADRDQVQFDKKILQRRYAGWRSSQLKKGIKEDDLLSFEQWQANPPQTSTAVNNRLRPLTTVDARSSSSNEINQLQPQLPTPTPTSTPSSTINDQLSTLSKEIGTGSKGGTGGNEGTGQLPYYIPSEDDWEKRREAAIGQLAAHMGRSF